MNKSLIILVATLFVKQSLGQSKIVVGQKHTIFVDVPKGWLQAQNDQLPFFIKPDKKNVSEDTYMYVFGIDYKSKPELSAWVKGNNEYILSNFKGVEIDTLTHKYDNFKPDEYLTGNYLEVNYKYPQGRHEVILVVECETSIVTAVLSTKDKEEFNLLLPSFIKLSKSLKILGASLGNE